MMNIKGLRSALALCGLVSLVGACGHGEQTGEWFPPSPQVDPPNTSTTGTVSSAAQSPFFPSPNVIEAQVDRRGDGSYGVHVSCKIPEPIAVHPLLVADTEVWAETNADGDKVCLGQTYELGEDFCRWVESNEARYRAIADCHKTALIELDRMGRDAVANLKTDGKTWTELKKSYVPAAWAMTPEQAVADLGQFSGWIALLMDGTQAQVPANPFCFDKEREATAREAKQAVRFGLWWLHNTRQAKEQWLLGSLERGVLALVNPDLPALQVSVDVTITPTEPNNLRCTFNLPPTDL